MSIKSLKKQLMAAIAMVLVAAVALASSTFAWFAANTTVTATTMNVTAKSNSQYLMIDSKNNASDKSQTATDIGAAYQDTATNPDKKVYPTYYSGTETTVLPGTAADGVTLPTMVANKWYTAQNKNANNANDATMNAKVIGESELKDYRLTYKVWLSLSNDSEDYTGTIKLIPTFGSGDASTSVAVKIGSNVYKLNEAGATNTPISAGVTTTEDITLSKNTSVEAEIYVFINGASENVNSDYINTPNPITGSASVTFELTNTTV